MTLENRTKFVNTFIWNIICTRDEYVAQKPGSCRNWREATLKLLRRGAGGGFKIYDRHIRAPNDEVLRRVHQQI